MSCDITFCIFPNYKANKLNENGKRCDVIPVLLMVDD